MYSAGSKDNLYRSKEEREWRGIRVRKKVSEWGRKEVKSKGNKEERERWRNGVKWKGAKREGSEEREYERN